MDAFVTQPIVQYAFAGFCAVLVGIIVWLIKELLRSSATTTRSSRPTPR